MDQFHHSGGFTLVEMMVAMMIGLIVLTAAYNIVTIQNRHFENQQLKLDMMQNGRLALDYTVQAIRLAGYNPTGTLPPCRGNDKASNEPCVGITEVKANEISFTADLNGNGNITADDTNPYENITYKIKDTGGIRDLEQTANGTKQLVASNISALSFSYYDGSNNATTTLQLIRKIRIAVTAKTEKPDWNNVYQTITLSSDIVPKNLTY